MPTGRRRAASSGADTSTDASERFAAAHAELDEHLRRLFPDVTPGDAHGMTGWRVPRPRRVDTWKGTVDPNFLHVYLAQRKNGITLHLWDPTQFDTLERNKAPLEAAGFKVMVGCMTYARNADFPVAPVVRLLEATRDRFTAEA